MNIKKWTPRTIEDAFYIHSKHIIPPFFLREVFVTPAPYYASIVDQHVEFLLSFPEFGNKGIATSFWLFWRNERKTMRTIEIEDKN